MFPPPNNSNRKPPVFRFATTYQYTSNDSPADIAGQYGITVNELLNANPGGYPFTTGQTLRIPRPQYIQSIEANRLQQQQAVKGALTAFGQLFTHEPYMGYGPNAPRGEHRRYPLYADATGMPNISERYPLYAANNPPPPNPYPMYAAGVLDLQQQGATPNQRTPYPGYAQPQAGLIGQTGQSQIGGPGGPSGTGLLQQWQNKASSIPGVSHTAQYLADYLAAGKLPPNMTIDQVRELKSAGVDVSPFAAYYNIGAEGKMTLNDAGKQATQAATSSTGMPAGNSDFMNTRFMQQNAEQGVSFYNQLRWDEDRKKYVKIGDLMRQGKLRPDGSWNSRGNRRGGRRPRPAPVADDALRVSNDFVNFGVSSG